MVSPKNVSHQKPEAREGLFLEAVDEFLDELSRLASEAPDRRSFYQHLTGRLQNITAASGVGIWMLGPDQNCIAVFTGSVQAIDGRASTDFRLQREQFDRVTQAPGVVLLDDRQASVFARTISQVDHEPKLLTLIIQEPLDARMSRVYADLAGAVADIAAQLEHRLIVDQQQQKFSRLEAYVQLLHHAHQSLDPRQVAYHVTNDARALLHADRVWLFQVENRPQLLACSSVTDVNERSRSFRLLQSVVTECVRNKKSSSVTRQDVEMVDQQLGRLAEYLEIEPIQGVDVVLLKRTGTQENDGVLVVEYFREHDRVQAISSLNSVVPCVESSLANALTHDRIPFRRSLLGMTWFLERLGPGLTVGRIAALLAIGGLLFVLFGIPVPFTIDAVGNLRPTLERHLFAPADGVVEQVRVEYGDTVAANQQLIQMSSPEYDLQIQTLQGELSAARKQLEANQLLRSQANRDGRDAVTVGQLTAEMEQNRLAIESINQNIKLYLQLLQMLQLQSPIAGQVISRDVELSLLNRPVRRGDRLLTIADTSADWQVVFQLSDRDFGYLQAAIQSSDLNDPHVRYRLSSDPGRTIESRVGRIDENNTTDAAGKSFVKLYVPFESADGEPLRVGTSVVGKVDCGRRSLFFIWTRDVRDFIRANFFWF